MINIDQINFSYHRRLAPVLSNFSLTVEPGRIYGLLGKNGTGKSTLLYLMAGLLRPQQGHVQFTTEDGNLMLEASERRPEMLCETFFVPEEFDLPNIPLKRYVDLNAPFYPKFSHEILNQCLTDFELPQNLHLGALSMGQKKKAFMSFALATNCRLLLMDEPTNGLDIPSKSLFRKVVTRHLTDDRTLIISTHQVADVAMLIDHVLMLSESQLLLNRPVSEISRVLRFEERPIGADISDALYVQPSIQGNALITLNHCPDNETPVNLELLFNCAQCGKLPAELL